MDDCLLSMDARHSGFGVTLFGSVLRTDSQRYVENGRDYRCDQSSDKQKAYEGGVHAVYGQNGESDGGGKPDQCYASEVRFRAGVLFYSIVRGTRSSAIEVDFGSKGGTGCGSTAHRVFDI